MTPPSTSTSSTMSLSKLEKGTTSSDLPIWKALSLFRLSCISIAISTLTFILSMLHLGYFSFWTVPIVFALSIGYHAVIITLEITHDKPLPEQRTGRSFTMQSEISPTSPSSSVSSITFASILVSLWAGCFAILLVMDIIACTTSEQELTNHPRIQLTSLGPLFTNKALLIFILSVQCILCLLEDIVMIIIARRTGTGPFWKSSRSSSPSYSVVSTSSAFPDDPSEEQELTRSIRGRSIGSPAIATDFPPPPCSSPPPIVTNIPRPRPLSSPLPLVTLEPPTPVRPIRGRALLATPPQSMVELSNSARISRTPSWI